MRTSEGLDNSAGSQNAIMQVTTHTPVLHSAKTENLPDFVDVQ